MAFQHIPVLLAEILQAAQEIPNLRKGLDVTFGRGGHAMKMLEQFPQMEMLGWDRDHEAVEHGQKLMAQIEADQQIHSATQTAAKRLRVEQKTFFSKQDRDSLPDNEFDFILADLGVSSPQLDDPARGFSFYNDGPLDMRMDHRQELSAADIVNTWSENELIELFQKYGEIRSPFRVVRAIISDRQKEPFTRTGSLAGMIERIDGWHKKGQHPATKYFLALRLVVNQELDELAAGLHALMPKLRDGGRLMVLTFHSSEDRIVKVLFKEEQDLGFCVNKKVIQATREESKINVRSRSAKLRIFQRGLNDSRKSKRGFE